MVLEVASHPFVRRAGAVESKGQSKGLLARPRLGYMWCIVFMPFLPTLGSTDIILPYSVNKKKTAPEKHSILPPYIVVQWTDTEQLFDCMYPAILVVKHMN